VPLADIKVNGDTVQVLTKKGLLLIAAIIAFAFVLMIIGFVIISSNIGDYRDNADRENAKRIDEIRALAQPTPKEFQKQIREGFERCVISPNCLKAIRDLVNADPSALRKRVARRRAARERQREGSQTPRGQEPRSRIQPRSDPGGGDDLRSRPPFRQPDSPGESSPPQEGPLIPIPPNPPDPPSPPRPEIPRPEIPRPDSPRRPEVTLPDLPIQVCTPLITLNC
jgi:hypothetical protein